MSKDRAEDKTQQKQLGSINLLRFLAAFSVMMYHYTFMFYERGMSYMDLTVLRSVFHYGYLGVDLFFIISGFVIALSADGRDAREFVVSRVVRLYPMLWICSSVTFLFFISLGQYHYAEVGVLKYLANLTMVPTLLGSSIIDGSYWSLAVELKFYAFVFLILIMGVFRYLRNITILLSVIVFVYTYYFAMPFNWISYFLAGILFYSVYKNKSKIIKVVPELISLILLMLVSMHYAVSRAPDLSAGYGVYFDPLTIAIYIATFYTLFLLIAVNKLTFDNTKLLAVLGAITYPVYLLHQEIGLMAFGLLERMNVNYLVAFAVVTGAILMVSYKLLSTEKSVQNMIRPKLKSILKL